MKGMMAVFRREVAAALATPTAYVFVAVFLAALGLFTFQVGQFFAQGQADLRSFFVFHPWLYMVFLPALAMGVWAEEARGGTIETLLTLPMPTWALVGGKFLAVWALAAGALALTAPMWITVNVLGRPDNLAILAGYLGSALMAGAYLAIGTAASALTRSQVAAFVGAVGVSFLLTALGTPIVLGAFQSVLGAGAANFLASLSILENFSALQQGVVEAAALYYFVSLIGLMLAVTLLAVNARRGG